MTSGFMKSRLIIALVSSIFLSGLVQLPAQAAPTVECLRSDGTTPGIAASAVKTDEQYVSDSDPVAVSFKRVGKDCALGNFKRIIASTDLVDSQGLLYSGVVSNADITLTSYPNPAGSNFQTVNYTQTFTESDRGKFFQYVFIDALSVVTKSSIVAVYPESYSQPRNMSVAIAPSNTDYSQPPY